MTPNVLVYHLLVLALVLICLVIHLWWPDASKATPPTLLKPDQPRRKRSTEPKPCSTAGWWKLPSGFKHTMQIVFDDYLPKWNYRAVPEGT